MKRIELESTVPGLRIDVGHRKSGSLISMNYGAKHKWWSVLLFEGMRLEQVDSEVSKNSNVPVAWQKYADVAVCRQRVAEIQQAVSAQCQQKNDLAALAALREREFMQRFGVSPAPASKIKALVTGGYIKCERGVISVKIGSNSEVYQSYLDIPPRVQLRAIA